ncbi:hypothetical protein [Novosphingobium sp. AAP83]|uniref:hypothetical protein n=1 Tax=Novosphingobium sp. AAP83 TaxID=1523425 RepID=UPI000AE79B74|nr:hypothetical protein [Novosphingobium sp. AAP83]
MNEVTSKRTLPERTYVSLSEALTWIAFGDALEAHVLKAQVEGERLIETDGPEERMRKLWKGELQGLSEKHGAGFFHERKAGLERLRDAWLKLRDTVDQEKVKVRGRYTSTYSTCDASLADVAHLAGDVLSTFSQFDVSTGGIRRQPEGAPNVLWLEDPSSIGRELDSFITNQGTADGYLHVEVARENVIQCWPNPARLPRKSHTQVVEWCRNWIDGGHGNGHDHAWRAFQSDTNHAGLSRDYVFRPAWKEAKTRT